MASAVLDANIREIDPREVRARRDYPIVKILVKKGFKWDIIKDLIHKRLQTTGADFESAGEMLMAYYDYVDEEKARDVGNQNLFKFTDASVPFYKGIAKSVYKYMAAEIPVSVPSEENVANASSYEDDKIAFQQGINQLRCKLCKDSLVSVTFLPCGHLLSCKHCSDSVTECIACGQRVTRKLTTRVGEMCKSKQTE